MIKELDGGFEKVDYDDKSSIILYLNGENENYSSHWHTATEIILPLVNEYKVTCLKKTFLLKEGDILIIPAGELHELTAPATGTRLILQFEPSLLRSISGFSGIMSFIEQLRLITPEKAPEIHQKVHKILLDIRDEHLSNATLCSVAIYAKIIEMYVILVRYYVNSETLFPEVKTGRRKEYMDKIYYVLEYINNHITDDLDLDTVANIAGFSKFHFSRLFNQFTNQSFYEYLNNCRVKKAESLLLNPKLSITDVAMRSGFSSISTFNRVFKNAKDCTPSEFKAMCRIYCIP